MERKDPRNELTEEINKLVEQRTLFRQQSKWKEADEIKKKLWKSPYFVKTIDTNDFASCTWESRRFIKEEQPSIVWTKLPSSAEVTGHISHGFPLVVGTVDSSRYQLRYSETIDHLINWRKSCSCCFCSIQIHPCYLLNLEDHQSIGAKSIVFEGWRQRLLPYLLQKLFSDSSSNNFDFIFVAEDDIRIPDHVTPCDLFGICYRAFNSHPDLDILSLGHSWQALRIKKKHNDESALDLNSLLQGGKGAGVHGATLFAIRFPSGVQKLQETMTAAADRRKQTHLDQFLFYSVYHNLSIALCDPPLVGWAEVDVTLTKSGSGHRRRGGGRLGFLPFPQSSGKDKRVSWIKRTLMVEKNSLT
jgi:hypothetical protein